MNACRQSFVCGILRQVWSCCCDTWQANIGPNSLAAEHTLNTLRYSDRVKELKSEGKGNKVAQAAAYAGPAALMEQGRGNFKLQLDERLELDSPIAPSRQDAKRSNAGGATAAIQAAAADRENGTFSASSSACMSAFSFPTID
jgi:hypothetical protein|eukprot:COSAG02_NODE_434_length_22429_cov_15.013704_14_plen_143_part_00